MLFLDANRLHADGLHLGVEGHAVAGVSALLHGSRIEVRDIGSLAGARETVNAFRAARQTYDVVVVVGHSNERGIQVASDAFLTWDAFGRFLKPLKPRRLILVACRAGRSSAGDALFRTNSSLRKIFACPQNMARDLGQLLMLAVPAVVAKRRMSRDDEVLLHAVAVARTGGQLRIWSRIADKGNPGNVLLDKFSDALQPAAEKVPRAIENFLTSFFR